jgi:uncharacterized caspase-like protein/tetratricopeptide (TPR) repeat protein
MQKKAQRRLNTYSLTTTGFGASLILSVLLFPCKMLCSTPPSRVTIDLPDLRQPKETRFFGSPSLIVRATFSARGSGIISEKILLNGDIVQKRTWPSGSKSDVKSNLVLKLRQFGNEVRFIVSYSDGTETTDTRNIFVQLPSATGEPTKWAIVAAPSSVSGGQHVNSLTPAVSSALISRVLRGRSETKIFTVLGPDATSSNIKSALYEVSRQMKQNDQLLFYYSGAGSYESLDHSPILATSDWNPESGSTGGLALSELASILVALDIPSVALVLDTSFAPNARSDLDVSYSLGSVQKISRESLIKESTASWLVPLQSHPSLEFLMASQFFQSAFMDTSGLGIFTKELAKELIKLPSQTTATSTRCPGFRDILKNLQTSELLRQFGQDPLYFSTTRGKPAFCFDVGPRSKLNMQFKVDSKGDAQVTGQFPANLSEGQLIVTVNQTIVQVRSLTSGELAQGNFLIQVPLSPGQNMADVRVETAGQALFEDSVELDYWAKVDVLSSPEASHRPVITIQQPAIYADEQDDANVDVQTEDSIPLDCVLHLRESREGTLEIRNNGVPIVRRLLLQKHVTSNFETRLRIPLNTGPNNIEVEVNSGGATSHKRVVVNHRKSQNLIALLVGVDKYEDHRIRPLSFAKSDVDAVRRLVLSYSEITPADIIMLKDEEATRTSISALLDSKILQKRLEAQGSKLNLSASTVLFYYSGYGATIPDSGGGIAHSETRCLMPYDANRDITSRSCLQTGDVDELLNKSTWQNTILILDTSYDGPAGAYDPANVDNDLYSKTLSTYRSPETMWRLLSGVTDGRMFLVAGGTNEPALESSRLKHGALTYGVLKAFDALGGPDHPSPEFSLQNLYDNISRTVLHSTYNTSNPVLKGSLTQPFQFRAVDLEQLRDRWRTRLTKIKRDSNSMLQMDLSDLEESKSTLDKADELFPKERSVLNGKALVSKYLGTISCRAKSVENCKYYTQQSRDLFSRAVADGTLTSRLSSYAKLDIYESELFLAVVHLENGEFQLASRCAQDAISANPESSLRARFTYAKVLLASSKNKEAADVLDEILTMNPRFGPAAQLSAEEWGKATIWRASLLRAQGKDVEERLLLEKYARGDVKGTKFFAAFVVPFARSAHALRALIAGPPSKLPSAWSNEIANYMLSKRGNGDELRDFIKDPAKDKDAIQCEVEYYIGLHSLWDRQSNAPEHFRLSVESGAADHLEYWLAKANLAKSLLQ